MNKRKGQLTLEFIGTALIFAIIAGLLALSVLEPNSRILQQSEDFQKNLEAQEITSEIITTSGADENADENWGEGDDLISFGLAYENEEFMTIKREKLQALNSIDDPSDPGDKVTYQRFTDLTGAENQYQFNFTWFPTVETFDHFEKETPPEEPDIREPTGIRYDDADDRVHYGNTSILGESYYYLVASQDGIYTDVYINDSWDFRGIEPIQTGEESDLMPSDTELILIQNRDKKPGTMIIFERNEREFGAQRDPDAATFKFNRYATYIDDDVEHHPMRMEVFVW